MYKTVFSLALLCFLALFVAGCGSDDATPPAEEPAKAETAATEATPKQDAAAAEKAPAAKPAPEEVKASPKPPALSAQELYDLYQKDADGADRLYKGKTLRITGVIWKVDTKEDGRGIPYLTFKTSSMFGSVICFFDRDQIPALKKLEKGAKVSLSGKCNGQKAGVQNVDIVDCVL